MNLFRLLFQVFLILVFFSGVYVVFWLHRYHESFKEGINTTTSAPTTTTPKPVTTTTTPKPVTTTTTPKPVTTAAPIPVTTTTTPKPVTTAAPIPVTTAAPIPVTTAAPKPVTTAAPKPVTTAAPIPVTTAAPIPVTTAAPKPVTTAAPKPVTISSSKDVTQVTKYYNPNDYLYKDCTARYDHKTGRIVIKCSKPNSDYNTDPDVIYHGKYDNIDNIDIFPTNLQDGSEWTAPDGTLWRWHEKKSKWTGAQLPDWDPKSDWGTEINKSSVNDRDFARYAKLARKWLNEQKRGDYNDDDWKISGNGQDNKISTYNDENIKATLAPVSSVEKGNITDYNEKADSELDDYVLNDHPMKVNDKKGPRLLSEDSKFLTDSTAYPGSEYAPFDPLSEDINHYEYVAKEFASTQPNGLSDNPMDPNWGGVMFTQNVIKSGKYNDNNITKPLLFQPKGIFVDSIQSGFGKPQDIL